MRGTSLSPVQRLHSASGGGVMRGFRTLAFLIILIFLSGSDLMECKINSSYDRQTWPLVRATVCTDLCTLSKMECFSWLWEGVFYPFQWWCSFIQFLQIFLNRSLIFLCQRRSRATKRNCYRCKLMQNSLLWEDLMHWPKPNAYIWKKFQL